MPKPTLVSVAVVAPPGVAPSRTNGWRLGRSLLVSWHLLSLDAPTVAALWTWYVATSACLKLPGLVLVAMFAAVWMLYAADRLLDSRVLAAPPLFSFASVPRKGELKGLTLAPAGTSAELEARHIFHHQHRRPMLAGISVCALLLAVLVPHFDAATVRLYLVLGAPLFAYFVLIHATASAHRLPKEISVGLFFSAAVFVPTTACAPRLWAALLPFALLFAALCSLNCLFIYLWEHLPDSFSAKQLEPHWLTRNALQHLRATALVLVGLVLALCVVLRSAAPLPIAASALLLLGLDRLSHRLARLTLRAAADLVLLTPCPLLLVRHLA